MLNAILCLQLRICLSKLDFPEKINTYKFVDYKEQIIERRLGKRIYGLHKLNRQGKEASYYRHSFEVYAALEYFFYS
jgi:hypothetical protein